MNKIQIPWEDRPVGCTDVMWRYSQNPVIGRYHIPSSNTLSGGTVGSFFTFPFHGTHAMRTFYGILLCTDVS